MQRMMRVTLVNGSLSALLATVLVACGGGGGGDSGGGVATTPIATAAHGQNAASTSLQAGALSAAAMNTLAALTDPVGAMGGTALAARSAPAVQSRAAIASNNREAARLQTMVARAMDRPKARFAAVVQKAKRASTQASVPVNNTYSCTYGGSYSETGSYDDVTGNFNVTLTFTDCREPSDTGGVERSNGTVVASGAFGATITFTEVIGSGNGSIGGGNDLTVDYFATTTDTTVDATLLVDATLTGSLGCGGACDGSYPIILTLGLSANGAAQVTEAAAVYTLALTNLSDSSEIRLNSDGSLDLTDALSGGISESWTSAGGARSATFTFASFTQQLAIPASASYYDYSLNGTVTVDFNLDALCTNGTVVDGTYTVNTVTPVRTMSTGQTSQGEVHINGNAVAIVFNADGTITVTVNGTVVPGITTIDQLEAVCLIEEPGL
jgi:hypothetical protein